MRIAWDLRSAREHPGLTAGEPPDGFLSAPERVFFERLRTPRRQREWLLGRWAAKALVRAWLRAEDRPAPAQALTIAPDDDGAPYAVLAGEGRLPITLSLSHRGEWGLCALADEPQAPLGADLELVEPRAPSFVESFFTAREQDLVGGAADPARAATEIWSLKEAALKALKIGLRADTSSVETAPRASPGAGWGRAGVDLTLPGVRAHGQALVRDEGAFVVSLAWLGPKPLEQPSEALRGQSVLEPPKPGLRAPPPPAAGRGCTAGAPRRIAAGEAR